MLITPRSIAVTLVLLLVMTILSLPKNLAGSLKMTLGGLFLPLYGFVHSGKAVATRVTDSLTPREVLVKRLYQLEQENHLLRLQAIRGEETQRENNRLRDQWGLAHQSPWKLKLGHVTGRDPANWWKSVHIDLGLRDGLRPNLPVLVSDGLVGRLGEVGYARSQVLLVGDPNCRVSAMILETRENTGMIGPPAADDFDDSLVELAFLSRHSVIKPGQKVGTSGQGGIFPQGIPVGVIVDSRVMELGLYQEARVKLAVDFRKIEEVWVILP
jgi:rod shape-determining protein MreC